MIANLAVSPLEREPVLRVLVTGIAGFIGSNTGALLVSEGHEVVGLDDLSTGRRANVPAGVTFVEGSCGDRDLVISLGRFDACIHFAGRIEAGISMDIPETFFAVNVADTMYLLEALIATGTPRFVFSSSAAVYGAVEDMPITEATPTNPESPYGESKLAVETFLHWLSERGRLRVASLRYFNAAGATNDHPEDHLPETHLIPLALDAASGRSGALQLFGTDYPTRDGTCIRDYVHVVDLARAHILAISALETHASIVCNLGTGTGSTIREVLDSVARVTGHEVPVDAVAARPGDPAAAVASNDRARSLLGWTLKAPDLDTIVRDAWIARAQ
jgi:UDP-glucose 4-epimerase